MDDVAELSEHRKVVLGVTGSIAAYKSAELARQLVSWGFEVRTVMTESAVKFITPGKRITGIISWSSITGIGDREIKPVFIDDRSGALVVL